MGVDGDDEGFRMCRDTGGFGGFDVFLLFVFY